MIAACPAKNATESEADVPRSAKNATESEAHGSEAHRVIGGAADLLRRAGCGVAMTKLDDESGCGEMSQRSRTRI